VPCAFCFSLLTTLISPRFSLFSDLEFFQKNKNKEGTLPVADADGDEEDDADGDEVDLVEALGQARHGDAPLALRVHAHRRAEVRREAARHGGVGEDVLHDQVRASQERRELPCCQDS
jgi:hypothetical protein